MTDSLPDSIVIAGAGAIGVEFAYVMAAIGVQVTWWSSWTAWCRLESLRSPSELAKAYKKLGVTMLAGTKVEAIDTQGTRSRSQSRRRRRVRPPGREPGPGDQQGAAGDRLRRALRATGWKPPA